MDSETFYNPNSKSIESRPTTTGGAVADDLATASRSTLAGKNVGSLAKPAKRPMPKQNPGEAASDYGERLRQWRAEDSSPANEAQKSALSGMK